jgi:hypothetical protein
MLMGIEADYTQGVVECRADANREFPTILNEGANINAFFILYQYYHAKRHMFVNDDNFFAGLCESYAARHDKVVLHHAVILILFARSYVISSQMYMVPNKGRSICQFQNMGQAEIRVEHFLYPCPALHI